MKPALFVKTLEVRKKKRPRELHRSGCWPRRSSHGRDHLGYQPCTLAPRPAPKSIATLSDSDSRGLSLLFLLRKRRSEVLYKLNFRVRKRVFCQSALYPKREAAAKAARP